MSAGTPTIAVFGASGLIGQAISEQLIGEGMDVAAFARRFTPAQRHAFGQAAIRHALADLDADTLARLISETRADIVVNCLGVLQDGANGSAHDIHVAFIERLLAAIGKQAWPILLIHLSVPGSAATDATAFSITKRKAEAMIEASGAAHVILRPAFVIAPAAFGGSALLRAMAALPVDLPEAEASRTFAITSIDDVTRTVSIVADRWRKGVRQWQAKWDVMERTPSTVGEVTTALRNRIGGPRPWGRLPSWTMAIGTALADAVSHLGWMPPIRSTALAEMRRGVTGDPSAWSAATGIEPATLHTAIRKAGATVQDLWFARSYLLKALVLASLAVFWIASGAIALFASFDAASAILESHGFSKGMADAATLVSSLADMSIGLAIAVRKTCRGGLIAGIALSLAYMLGAAILTPDLWLEPLGALVKTGPAIVLMLVALAILPDRG
jgi:uncharacterized protein YbjT (DUF2867 family)